MTQEEIIRMALEAFGEKNTDYIHPKALERFAALVAKHWIETNKALAKEIIELKKQAEQDAFAGGGKPIEEQHIPSHVHIIKQMEIIPEQEPVAEVDDTAPGFINWTTWKLPEHGTKLYAATLASQDTHATHVVRTKDPCNPLQDLTDDEIHKCMNGNFYNALDFARAVIAAYKEKNK